MAEETKLLQVTVEAEELPRELEVNGVRYLRADLPPDSICRELVLARLYFHRVIGADSWGTDVSDMMNAWVALRKCVS